MRRSVFVNVPSFSAKEDAGKTTSAYFRVQEDVLGDQKLELAEPFLDVVRVRLGLGRVLTDQVHGLQAVVVEPAHHLVEPVAGRLRHVDAPSVRELLPDLGIVHRLVAGQV